MGHGAFKSCVLFWQRLGGIIGRFIFLGKVLYLYIFTDLVAITRSRQYGGPQVEKLLKVSPGTSLVQIKASIESEITEGAIKVFQQIGASEYLIELTNATQVRELIENGFDAGSNHIRCHPPQHGN